MSKIRKTPTELNYPVVLSEESIVADDDNACTAPTMPHDKCNHLSPANQFLHFTGAAVAEWSWYWIVAGLATSSCPVPLKTARVERRCTLNISRAQTSFRWCGVVKRKGVLAKVSSTSLDHGSKLRGPSPKSLM
ncbi:uncharacterized protein TNCV_3973541 [Trichonephila clavipes]|nr:uncharacterized protein TNCV_3973541 [Trichonephila clavipes]